MTCSLLDYDLLVILLYFNIFIDLNSYRTNLSIMLSRKARFNILVLQLPSRRHHKIGSVLVPQKVLGVVCDSIWGCGSVRKEDLGQPLRLTKKVRLARKCTHIYFQHCYIVYSFLNIFETNASPKP